MSINRTTSLTGQALRDMLARQDDARMSLACENMYLTDKEEAVFAEMARLGLSYDARIDYLTAYLSQSAPALAAE
ncbi:MAG: hypothetical protein NPIRA01_34670 [Nitrospirales bacterium]|nr:MAG: hypothetical protein NPIRA01_34670 [Nitrospirales bacterium]